MFSASSHNHCCNCTLVQIHMINIYHFSSQLSLTPRGAHGIVYQAGVRAIVFLIPGTDTTYWHQMKVGILTVDSMERSFIETKHDVCCIVNIVLALLTKRLFVKDNESLNKGWASGLYIDRSPVPGGRCDKYETYHFG